MKKKILSSVLFGATMLSLFSDTVYAEDLKTVPNNAVDVSLHHTAEINVDLEEKISVLVGKASREIKIITKEDIQNEKDNVTKFMETLNLREQDKINYQKELSEFDDLKKISSLKDKYKQISDTNTEEDVKIAQQKERERQAQLIEEAKRSSVENIPSFLDEADQALWNSIGDSYKNDSSLAGLTPHVAKMKVFLGEKFGINSFSLFRPGDTDGVGTGHGDGLAIDLMVPMGTFENKNDLGDEISNYLAKNFNELKINYIIWEQRFYMNMSNIYGPGYSWNIMDDRGSITQNHYDHVHISFKQ